MMKNHLQKTLLVGVLALMTTGAWAADPNLESDYTLMKSVTWGDGTNITGEGACAHTAYDTGNKKQQSLTILTAPEAAAGWIAMQAWTDGSGKGWWNRADKGLYCVNAGRSAAVFGDDLTTGWLVVFECTTSASSVMTLTNAGGDPDGTFTYTASEDGQKYFCTITAAEDAYVGFCGNKNAGFISKISVYKPNNAVVLTTYTVNYVDMDGNTLKESVTYDAVGGATITLSDADKANITIGEDTYVYDSDDTEGKTVAEDGSSVITVKFHKAQNFSYTVNEMCAGTAARVTESFSYETAKVTVPYRKYNAVDGQLYTKGATNKEYNYSFNLTQNNQVEDIDYAAVSDVDNVVFLTEGEDVEGLTPCNSANTAIRSSNSASAYATADTKIVTLAAGKYKIHAIIYDASKTPASDWTFKAGAIEVATFHCTTVNIQEFDSNEFAIGKETDIIMSKAGSNNMGLDMIYIIKTGDVTDEEAADLNAAAEAAEAIAAAKADLQADIDSAKDIDTTDKVGAEALANAISEAETALAAEDATVETLNAALAALAEAVAAFNAANVTVPVVANASFEADGEKIVSNGPMELTGWTFNGVGSQYNNTELRSAQTATTTSQFGTSTPNDGDYFLFFRQGWNGNGNAITLTSDALTTLPAGNYLLSVAYKQHYSYDNTSSNNTFVALSLVNGETQLAAGQSPSAEGAQGANADATYFNDTEWSTLEVPFSVAEAVSGTQVVITLNAGGQRRSDFLIDHVQLQQVASIEMALIELQKAIEAARALAATYNVGDGLFMYAESEIAPLTQAIADAQAAYDARESEDAVNAAAATLTAFLSTFAPVVTAPDVDKAYTFQLRINSENPLYMKLSESGISIEEEATPLKFIAAEKSNEYYLANLDNTLFVGLAGGNAWTMSATAEQKAAWAFTAMPDGAYRICNLVTTGRFVGTNSIDQEAGKPCYADKLPSNGNIDWIIADASGITDNIQQLNAGEHNHSIFTLSGQMVTEPKKGLYIVNGKKMVIK